MLNSFKLILMMIMVSSCRPKETNTEFKYKKYLSDTTVLEKKHEQTPINLCLPCDAQHYDYTEFSGKIISSIRYCSSCGPAGDFLIFKFTDGVELKVYVYKYNMKLY